MKDGIEYFSVDVQDSDAMELIEAEFGLTGFAIIIKLLQKIYGSYGYYCEWTDDIRLIFCKKIGYDSEKVSTVVKAAIQRGLFDKDLYEKYKILTSAQIQKNYFEAASRRKEVRVKIEYILIPIDTFSKNVCFFHENDDISKENEYIFEQSKVKESKGKESEGKERKVLNGFAAVLDEISDKNLKKSIGEFINMRNAMKKPLTPYALTMNINKLSELTCDVAEQNEIVNQSIINGWQGFYPIMQLKEYGNNQFLNLLKEECNNEQG